MCVLSYLLKLIWEKSSQLCVINKFKIDESSFFCFLILRKVMYKGCTFFFDILRIRLAWFMKINFIRMLCFKKFTLWQNRRLNVCLTEFWFTWKEVLRTFKLVLLLLLQIPTEFRFFCRRTEDALLISSLQTMVLYENLYQKVMSVTCLL